MPAGADRLYPSARPRGPRRACRSQLAAGVGHDVALTRRCRGVGITDHKQTRPIRHTMSELFCVDRRDILPQKMPSPIDFFTECRDKKNLGSVIH